MADKNMAQRAPRQRRGSRHTHNRIHPLHRTPTPPDSHPTLHQPVHDQQGGGNTTHTRNHTRV
jgi:hypothetical protein